MSLEDEYRRQFAWRDWTKAISMCPISKGQRILDLGCGPGDLSAEFLGRGALVTGVDSNPDFIEAARERCPHGSFERQDLKSLSLTPESYDGLWCSFTAAYFTDFGKTFSSWLPFLKRNAWVCITDIDDLLGHDPMSERTRKLLQDFYEEALQVGRYDFKAGRKIQRVLEECGFRVSSTDLEDQELSFQGAASEEIRQAWGDRLKRMGGLKAYLKENFAPFRDEFIQCISSPNHRSRCRVISCVGART